MSNTITASNLDRILTTEEEDAIEAFDAEQVKPASVETLTVDGTLETWSVVDAKGGRWWPSDEALAVINTSSDPETTALYMCRDEPSQGEWYS